MTKWGIVLSLFFVISSVQGVEQTSLARSLCKIYVTRQGSQPGIPWSIGGLKTTFTLGTVVSEDRILASGQVVFQALSLYAHFVNDPVKYPLSLLSIDRESDLALLGIQAPSLKPLKIKSPPSLQTTVSIAQLDNETSIDRYQARFVRLTSSSVYPSRYKVERYLLETINREYLYGSPVLYKDYLVGIITQGTPGLQALPAEIIKNFLYQFKHQKFGFVGLDFQVEKITDRLFYQQLGLPEDVEGLRITKVYSNSYLEKKVFVNDLLIEIDRHSLNTFGYYKHPIYGLSDYFFILNQKKVGEPIVYTIQRGNKILEIMAISRPFSSNQAKIPFYRKGKEPYLVFGGLVFQELSYPYLRTWGKNWLDRAPFYFTYLVRTQNNDFFSNPSRFIILNEILPNAFNRGYRNFRNLVIKKVNNQVIHSLQDMYKALQKHPVIRKNKKFAIFQFEPQGVPLVLAYDDLKKSHEGLVSRFNLPQTTQFFKFMGKL